MAMKIHMRKIIVIRDSLDLLFAMLKLVIRLAFARGERDL